MYNSGEELEWPTRVNQHMGWDGNDPNEASQKDLPLDVRNVAGGVIIKYFPVHDKAIQVSQEKSHTLVVIITLVRKILTEEANHKYSLTLQYFVNYRGFQLW